jgi:peptidoglycan/xylan/chitin deacetylase (PgdA/CDA1 family)
MLGQTNSWDRHNRVPPSELMSAGQLQQWLAGGQEVGAHTRHHVRLTEVDTATAQDEIARSKTELEQLTGAPVSHFCYPYGVYTPEHVAMVAQAGFVSATTTQRGRCHAGNSLLELPRVPVLRRTSRPLLWWKLASRYEDQHRT